MEQLIKQQMIFDSRHYIVRLIQYLNLQMDQSEFQEKAIQLVYVTNEGKYEMHPQAEQFLAKVPKPLSIISVAGLYRTGKSYLLNRILLNRNNGFGVGPTINPCTKGLWCWGTPLKGTMQNGQKTNILIVDSEGIGALDEDQNHDVKIFTLAILTSSIFIYNSVGSIDENALQNLSLVVSLTKNIQLNSQSSQDQDPQDLAKYFPTFFWVVRDFSLQLISSEGENISPKQYLQKALAPQKGFSDDVQEKNRIRRMLTSFFKDRDCATLIRPLVNEQKLQHLYQCSFQDLRPEFVEQALSLRKKIFLNAKAKMFKGQYLDGSMYISMIKSYLNSINNGSVPNIQNAWTYMCIQKCMKLQDQCYDYFKQEIENNLRSNIPCTNQEFDAQIQLIENQCYSIFEREQIGQESKQYLKSLKAKIKDKISALRIENQRESINVLKSFIMKNFTVIQKKMKMNQYQNFQQFTKCINSFYIHLLENGPNLPKKEIVYLDFLKKVTTQGADVFLRQLNQNLQSLKSSTQEKQKYLSTQNHQLKQKLKQEIETNKEKYNRMMFQKSELEKRCKHSQTRLEEQKINHKTQINKLQTNFENKLKVLEIKNGQLTILYEEMKQKKANIESGFMVQKKERQKEKALMQLKLNQMKEDLKNLKIKEKNQQIKINDLTYEFNLKIKETTLEFEKKNNELNQQLKSQKIKLNEVSQLKEFYQKKIQNLQKNHALNLKRYQQEVKTQIQKFDNYKIEFQTENIAKLQLIDEENLKLRQQLNTLKDSYAQAQQKSKETLDKLKNISVDYETKLALIKQQNQFLLQQMKQVKEDYQTTINQHESLLKNKRQHYQQELEKLMSAQKREITQQHAQILKKLESSISEYKQKLSIQQKNAKQIEEKLQFQFDMERKNLQNEIRNKNFVIQSLEEFKEKQFNDRQNVINSLQEEYRSKQLNLNSKIRQLQNQLQSVMERSIYQQEENNNKSQQSLKQLKNFYQLEKEKLQQKVVMEKDKYEKRIEKLRDEYQTQIQDEKRNFEEQYDNLKDQYTNEVTVLNQVVQSLQHENDSKNKSVETLQKRLTEQKEKLQRKQIDFSNKIEGLIKNGAIEKQLMQVKISQTIEQKTQLQKQIIVINHQKDQITKEIKQINSKFDSKVEECFYLNKSIEKIQNQNRQKLTQLNNEYMNQKLNYQKKIALSDQQKQFYFKKLQQYEKDNNKNVQNWEQKFKKLKNDMNEQIKEIQMKKNNQYDILEAKYEKLKKSSKDYEQQMMRNLSNIERQFAIQQQKYYNMSQKYQELQQKKLQDSDQLITELSQTKQTLNKITKESNEQIIKLKKELSEAENQRNQISLKYDKDKILTDNKLIFIEQIKQKNKRQYVQKIKSLEQTLQNVQKTRINDKNYYQGIYNENIQKTEKKYYSILQQTNQNWMNKQKDYEQNLKKSQQQVRNLTQKLAIEMQSKQESIKVLQRRIKQYQQNQKRIQNDLQKYKMNKQTMNSDNMSIMEKQRQNLRFKMQEKQQKYKRIEALKQQMYLDFEKQRAKWNLQKDMYSTKNEQLRESVSKFERDNEKLMRQNEKLKAQRRNSKMSSISSISGSFSKYAFQKGNSKYNLQDSVNSINLSITKENSNPLGQISFFNNQ